MVTGVSMDTDSADGNWWDTVDMTKLILACNKISSIPPDISNLLGLQILDLHDNQLETLPESISSLSRCPELVTGLTSTELQLRSLRFFPDNAAPSVKDSD